MMIIATAITLAARLSSSTTIIIKQIAAKSLPGGTDDKPDATEERSENGGLSTERETTPGTGR